MILRNAKTLLLLVLALLCGPAVRSDETRFELENGLEVILHSRPGVGKVAIMLLYDIGELHDPRGKSGLSHMVEHLYMTSAVGETEARTHEQLLEAYRGQVKVKTGRDYTVFSVTVETDGLQKELSDFAARMTKLDFLPGDLERELPRLRAELDNMYGGDPSLTATVSSSGAALPLGKGARRGGQMADVEKISLVDVREWHRRHYKANNATLVLAGAFDLELAESFIVTYFKDIKPGVRPEVTSEPGESRLGGMDSLSTFRPLEGWAPPATAKIAYRAPDPNSKLYAPFLVILSNMMDKHRLALRTRRIHAKTSPPVTFMPIDLPELFWINRAVLDPRPGDEEIIQSLREKTISQAEKSATKSRRYLNQSFAPLLGIADEWQTEMELKMSPQNVAFGVGRRKQLGIDTDKLRSALKKVKKKHIRSCAKKVFGEKLGAAVVVRLQDRPPEPPPEVSLPEEASTPESQSEEVDPTGAEEEG